MSKAKYPFIAGLLLLMSSVCCAQSQPASPITDAVPAPAAPATPGGAQPIVQAPAAGGQVKTETLTTLPNDNENYRSDNITYSHDKYVQLVDLADSRATLTDACLPAYSTVLGKGPATTSNVADAGWLFQVLTLGAESEKSCAGKRTVRKGDVVLIRTAAIKVASPTRSGFTIGTLLIPFKYQWRGDQTFSSGASLGGFVGGRTSTDGIRNVTGMPLPRGFEIQAVTFLGATTTSVKETVDGKERSSNLTGATYGFGVLGTVKETFQLGVVIGKDRFNRSSPYVNNGKTWIAATIGFTFTK